MEDGPIYAEQKSARHINPSVSVVRHSAWVLGYRAGEGKDDQGLIIWGFTYASLSCARPRQLN